MSQPIEAVMAGAGNRGYYAYGPYALQHPDEIRFTAVVEPHDERRRRFAVYVDDFCRRALGGGSETGKECSRFAW